MSNSKDFKVKNGIQPTVYHEGVGSVTSNSVGYSLATASDDNISFSLGAVSYANGFVLGNNGTKLYTVYSFGDIYQYSLSTAYDISTASYDSVSKTITAQDSALQGINFKPDGTKMYIVGATNDDAYQYNLSTAWDLSTAVYNATLDLSTTVIANPYEIIFNDDGTKVYILSGTYDDIFQYSLSTAYDISTASYDSKTLSLDAEDTTPYGFQFLDNGNKIWVCGRANDAIYQYNLTTAYDISTGSYSGTSFATSQDPHKFNFNADGTKIILLGSIFALHQYSTVLNTNTLDLSTGSVFEITPTSDIQINLSNPADSGTVSQATLLLDQVGYGGYNIESPVDTGKSVVLNTVANPTSFFLGSAGTKLYTTSAVNNAVYQYTLSTAYDISTASYDSVSLSIVGQQDDAYDITFKPDGTIMYITDVGATDSVFQYTLSTAWDLSTASYASKSFSFGSQDTNPEGVSFNTNGTKMYMVGRTGDAVYQYSLSTAYDVSTASYDSVSFSVSSQDATPFGLEFNSTGTKMYILGSAGTSIYQYSLSTAFDISSVSYDSISYDYTSVASTVYDFTFNDTGSKLYIMSNTSAFELDTVSAATITYPSTLEWPSGTAPTSPAIGETDVLTFTTSDGGTSYQAVQAIDGAS